MINNKITIDVSQFSDDPWGRDEQDNPISSGAAFRKQYLIEAFNQYDKVIVDFSKLQDMPDSGFLGESFVGLVKHDGFTYEEVLKKLVVLPQDEFYPITVEQIITLARDEYKRVNMQGK